MGVKEVEIHVFVRFPALHKSICPHIGIAIKNHVSLISVAHTPPKQTGAAFAAPVTSVQNSSCEQTFFTVVPGYPANPLATARCRAATHAPITAPVSGHDCAADVAARRVAQVDELFQRVGGVVDAAIDYRGRAPSS